MTKPEEFFSLSHKRLLNIAVWAKYLAWVALIGYLIWAVLQIAQYQVFLDNNVQPHVNIWSFLRSNPFEAFRVAINMATTALKGVIYYLVLKGLSLGLNMVVETDINCREQEEPTP